MTIWLTCSRAFRSVLGCGTMLPKKPRPGDFVVASLEGEQNVIVRKYKQLSASKAAQRYELIALNEDWADIRVGSNEIQAQIIGCGVGLIRGLKN